MRAAMFFAVAAAALGTAIALPGPVEAGDLQRKTAREGPIELTLEVASQTVALNGAPWVAVELRNVGKSTITIVDELFSDNGDDIRGAHQRRSGPNVFFEVRGPSGHLTNFGYQPYPDECLEFNRRIGGEEPAEPSPPTSRSGGEKRGAWNLAPGEKLRTKDWVFEPINPRSCKVVRRETLPPVADEGTTKTGFQELGAFRFSEPGKYKIRAVYDSLWEVSKAMGLEREPEDARVETGWITVHAR